MEVQLIEAYVPGKYLDSIDEGLQKFKHESYWITDEPQGRKLIRMLVKTSETEGVLNYLEGRVHAIDGFDVLLFPIQTFLTRASLQKKEDEREEADHKLKRASRHELLSVIEKSSKPTMTYILLIILSAIVVTIGFIRDSEAVVIGAMVIAPMLGPIISTAFASILGDYKLLVKSLVTLVYGIAIVLGISLLFSLVIPIPFESYEFMSRTHVNLLDIVLALASGTAGALSILNRLPGSLVGVMVAAALLPPTVVLGTTIGYGLLGEAYGSMLLLFVNITSILLSAIIVFSLSGIRPVKWEEVQRANTSRKRSFLFVLLIIALLILAILFGENQFDVV